ncbi:MAG: enoyl-CoA hydratase/isomerase family protein [Thermodesulfobacteriota bacterium]
MSDSTILIEEREGILMITLNRPEVMNAFNLKMISEVSSALDRAEKDRNIKVVIITAAGKVFCAGADLKEIQVFFEGGRVNSRKFDAFSQTLNCMLKKIERLKKPVIAAINGYALAGGLELVMVCDLAICSEKAWLGDQHANVGLLPASGGTQRLPRIIGLRKAKELLLTGDMITAEEAGRLGLVNRVVRHDDLLVAAIEMAEKIVSKSPVATEALKGVIYDGMHVDLSTALELERGAVLRHHGTEDIKEGINSFLEKRKPVFGGK